MELAVNKTKLAENRNLTEEDAIRILRQKNAYFAVDGGGENEESMADVAAFLDCMEMLKCVCDDT